MENTNTKPIIVKQPLGYYAKDLLDRANEYWSAALALNDTGNKGHTYPIYFLIAHALECYLKAYLTANGVPKKHIKRNLGHNIIKIYEECINHNIPEINDLKKLCENMNEMNKDYDFRYPTGYKLLVPSIESCTPIFNEIIQKITPVITAASISAKLEFYNSHFDLIGKRIIFDDD